jgi:transcriptional regulator with PAS, ATPase and Fis domain
VIVNCVSIPESLFESELFGYAPGSFTGALKAGKPGYFERADKGTVFLDEIGDIPLSIQAKLLQVLQDKEFERVGGTSKQSVDVRIIAATNRDLRQAIAQKLFREDLYYRLNVIAFHLPALRERRQDIVPLAATFIGKYNRLIGSHITGIKDSARKVLREYDWPGNIRELENAIEHAANYVWEGEIGVENLPGHIVTGEGGIRGVTQVAFAPTPAPPLEALEDFPPVSPGAVVQAKQDAPGISFRDAKAEFERSQIIDALKQTGGNKSAAAKLIGLSRSAFYERLGKYGL